MAGVLSYSLELDAAGLTSAIGSAQASLSGLQQRMDAIGSRGGIFDGQSRSAITAAAGFKQAGASTQSLVSKLSDAGMKAANIVAGAKAVGTAWRASARFFQNGGISGALTRVRSGLRSIATDPGMRRLALAAGAATLAIGGTYAAIRTLRAGAAGIGAAGNGFRSLGNSARSASGGISSLAGKLISLPALLAGGAAGAGALGLAFKAFKAAADMESTTVSIRTMVGDIQRADTLIANLKKMGASTPFEFTELAVAGKSLVAFGVAAENVVPQLRDIGDVASGLNIPIGELSEIFGKAKVQGTLFAEDIYQLSGRGVPIFKALAEAMGKNENEIKKLASEGKITFPFLEQAFRNLTAEGGQFHDMMAKQSLTTNGLLSTLKSNLHEILVTLGEPITDMMKPVISGWIEKSKTFGIALSGIIGLLREASAQGRLGEVIGTGLQLAAVKFINKFSGGIRGAVAFLGAALPEVFGAVKNILFSDDVMNAVKITFMGIGLMLDATFNRGAAKIAGSLGMTEKADSLSGSADLAEGIAGGMFNSAAELLKSIDTTKWGAELGKATESALKNGAKAFSTAASKDLINEKPFLSGLRETLKPLNPENLQKIFNPETFLPKDTGPEKRPPVDGLKQAGQELTGVMKAPGALKPAVPPAVPRGAGLGAAARNALEETEVPRRRGLLNAGETVRKRLAEARAQGKRIRIGALDGIALRDVKPRRFINPKRALEAADRAARAADPRPGRGAAAADPQRKAADALLTAVTEIKELFSNLATA